MLVHAAGDIAASDTELFSARIPMINLSSFDSAVHMLLAEWTLVPAHLFAVLRCHIRLWRARFVLAGGVCSGSLRTHGTRCAIWQSLFAALHFWGECTRGFLLGPCQNFLTHFVYDGLLPSAFLAPPQWCQPLVRATRNLTHQGQADARVAKLRALNVIAAFLPSTKLCMWFSL